MVTKMIKVLDKTFAILEEIVKAVPSPVTPLEIAEKLSLNRPTCSRIIRSLVDAGYVIQVSRQAGYTAGPRILTLNNMAAFQNELLKVAVPVADRLAAQLEDAVLLTQIWQQERYVLYLANRNPRRNIRLAKLSYNDAYTMATGALEMAYLPLHDALEIYDNTPEETIPKILPDFLLRQNVKGALAVIRKNGFYHYKRKDIGIFAVPVFRNHRYLAALGCSVDIEKCSGEGTEQIISQVKESALEITKALSTNDITV